ncbi:uncharacterized protein LTR77_005607 [Saxophila tyrrhenica]|uniref:Uncharacterized protein n=1 Tax=Saxophila tyrrhenica TaxID=1690608 RepID=A0AAV9PD83_9PEZI|nr:hypothetical protein LTR77_005607 [Saxophila tyrrhenica]
MSAPNTDKPSGKNWTRVADAYVKVINENDLLNPVGAACSELFDVVDKTLPFDQASYIMDIGTGSGPLISKILTSPNQASRIPDTARLVAADIAQGLLDKLEERKAEQAEKDALWKRLEVRNWDARDLKEAVGDGEVSHLLSTFAYFAFADDETAVAEAVRILKPGGLFVETSMGYTEWGHLPTFLEQVRPGLSIPGPGAHWKSIEGVKQHLANAGFVDTQAKEFKMGLPFETHEAVVQFVFEAFPFMKGLTADFGEEEVARGKEMMLEFVRQKHPEVPLRLDGTGLIGWGRNSKISPRFSRSSPDRYVRKCQCLTSNTRRPRTQGSTTATEQHHTLPQHQWTPRPQHSNTMLPSDDCDDCVPQYLKRQLDSVPPSTIVLSSLPFLLTWIATAVIAQRRIYPVLSSDVQQKDALPVYNKSAGKAQATDKWDVVRKPSAQSLSGLVFSTSIGLSAVLVELLLCEISNTLNPAARGLALRVTLGLLLVLSGLITPALEIHGIVKATSGGSSTATSTGRTKPRLRLAAEVLLFGAWLLVFWYIPQTSLLRKSLRSGEAGQTSEWSFTEACLERIGIIGISLMASLSGFAAVSSLWQNFGVRHRTIRDTDIARKEAGLTSTEEMLAAKQSRLRALQRKMSESASASDQAGFVGRVMGSFRGNPELQEVKALQMEVSGLETMRFSLSTSLSNLRLRYSEQQRARTKAGRLLNIFNTIFAVYCAYRICATSLSSLRRWWQPNHSFATSDPINNILALLTTHWDSNLNRAAWSRQISFLLSGVMLLASFNAVLQTFRLFARFAPGLLQHAQTSLPLIISQVAGTYVISSALLLRSNLPAEVSSVITEALGAPLEGKFVEGWFESWFLAAVGLTATGILIGRKVGNTDDAWDDDDIGMEMGSKRS